MNPREGGRQCRKAENENESMLELIECNHENFDGSGYPGGIKTDKIPVGDRILAVAEAYISLTSNSPYRDPWESGAALTEIGKYVRSGKFDPEIVEVLEKVMGASK